MKNTHKREEEDRGIRESIGSMLFIDSRFSLSLTHSLRLAGTQRMRLKMTRALKTSTKRMMVATMMQMMEAMITKDINLPRAYRFVDSRIMQPPWINSRLLLFHIPDHMLHSR